MELPNPLKQQKLTIVAAVLDAQGNFQRDDTSKKFEAQFNPAQCSFVFESNIVTQSTTAPGEPQLQASTQKPPSFSLKLTLDSTGVTEMGLESGFGLISKSVKDQVSKFLAVCYQVEEATHRVNLVHIRWGKIDVYAILERVTINYTLFDQGGLPLRADLDAAFKTRRLTEIRLSSPDLTHARVVKAGDTLPLLAREIYGSSRHYLLVARANDLDDFRNLRPGTTLYFPPLETGTA